MVESMTLPSIAERPIAPATSVKQSEPVAAAEADHAPEADHDVIAPRPRSLVAPSGSTMDVPFAAERGRKRRRKAWGESADPRPHAVATLRLMDRTATLVSHAPNAFFAQHSRSFSYAARLFPAEQRRVITLIYAYCRLSDDLVDKRMVVGDVDTAKSDLARWRALSEQAYRGEPTPYEFLNEIMSRTAKRGVPFSLIESLLDGVASDIGPVVMEDTEELLAYCYRVASVVGVWITRMFGIDDPALIERAEVMGVALQLTNILRDVGEDLAMNRVYLPRTHMERFRVERADLEAMAAGAPISPAYRSMLEDLMDRAERCYELADEALPELPTYFARPMAAASAVYRGILGEIRRNDHDNLRLRAATSTARKPVLAARGLTSLAIRSMRPGRHALRPLVTHPLGGPDSSDPAAR